MAINDFYSGKHFSVPSINLILLSLRFLKGFFEPTRWPSRAIKLQGQYQVCGKERVRTRTLSRASDANLICIFVKNTFVFKSLKLGKGLENCPPSPNSDPPDSSYGVSATAYLLFCIQKVSEKASLILRSFDVLPPPRQLGYEKQSLDFS